MVKTKKAMIKYSNNFFKVLERSVNLNNMNHNYFSVDKADVVVIIPITNDGKIILERQFRPAINKSIYEVPAGNIEEGETPQNAALRELKEETGYRAGKLIYLAKIYGSPGILSETQHLFLATRLRKGERHLDPTEDIKIKAVSKSVAMNMILNKKINDAKTMVAILYLNAFSDLFK